MTHSQPAHGHLRATCAACQSSVLAAGREVFDDRYGNPDVFHLVSCERCGHVMTAPPLTEADLPALYSTYYPRRDETASGIHRQLQRFKAPFGQLRRWLMGTNNQGQYQARTGSSVLDVGSGSGLSLLEARALGAEAFGIEADPNVAVLAKELGITVHIGNIYDNPFPGRTFDLVALNQVIEHVAEPDRTLDAIRQRIKPNGRLIAAFPNRGSFWRRLAKDRWLNWHIPFHQNHFDARSFALLAKRCGFTIERYRTITPNVWTMMQLRVWRERPIIGVPSVVWSTAAGGSQELPSRMGRRIRVILLLPVVTVINRIVDALGYGDSLVFDLKPAGPK